MEGLCEDVSKGHSQLVGRSKLEVECIQQGQR